VARTLARAPKAGDKFLINQTQKPLALAKIRVQIYHVHLAGDDSDEGINLNFIVRFMYANQRSS
jgi:hypothetical protein